MQFGNPEVHTDSDHEFHKDLYRTLVLLAIDASDGPVYPLVEGLCSYSDDTDPDKHSRYFYEEHTCPTNFVGPHSEGYGVVALYADGNRDPHGVFRFVRAVWMPQRYLDAKRAEDERGHNMGLCPEDILEKLFPELTDGHARICTHAGLNRIEQHYVQPGDVCTHPERVTR